MDTVFWQNNTVKLIDQTLLPSQLRVRTCRNIKDIAEAIYSLRVRGAPAIGVAAALGLLLVLRGESRHDPADVVKKLKKAIIYIGKTRPTAVNLCWALKRMKGVIDDRNYKNLSDLKGKLQEEAFRIVAEDKASSMKMRKYGEKLILAGDRILTHCNTGPLATAAFGTAMGVIIEAHKKKKIKVFATETRPLLQGARLSIWEMHREGMQPTLICDSMAASLIKQGLINKIFVGADRIAANGDVANKIGTYMLSLAAKYHKIPFYVVAPASTVDRNIASGKAIPIEERPPDEIKKIKGKRITDNHVLVCNPAFDVTPASFISAIITDKGVLRPPYRSAIQRKIR